MASSVKKKSILEMDISIGGVGLTQRALFAKHLAVMLRSGLSITEALQTAQEAARGKLNKVTAVVLESVVWGQSLSSSLSEYPRVFPGLFVNVTRAGEVSGTLPENLENIAEQLEKERQLLNKIRGAMIYPVIILAATFALGLGISFIVLPKITPLFEGLQIELPITTRLLISFSHFVQQYNVLLLVGILGAAGGLVWIVRQQFARPVTHWLLLHSPILKNITKSSNLARFSRTLGMLLKSGVHIDEALDITKSTMGNYYYQAALERVSRNTRVGAKLSENLEQFPALFPVIVTRMIQVGEETGKFEETLFYLADFYEAEVDNATKSLSTAIEPLLLLFIGLIVGFLALSIITPIYDVTGNIQR